MRRMTRTERVVAAGCFLLAFVAFSLASTGTARADFCVFTMNCEAGNCTIMSVNCPPFSGDCDNACDTEKQDCVVECQSQGGTHCDTTCGRVWVACIVACVPWL